MVNQPLSNVRGFADLNVHVEHFKREGVFIDANQKLIELVLVD